MLTQFCLRSRLNILFDFQNSILLSVAQLDFKVAYKNTIVYLAPNSLPILSYPAQYFIRILHTHIAYDVNFRMKTEQFNC